METTMGERKKLDALDELVLDEIIAMSDDDARKMVSDAEIDNSRTMFERACVEAGKKRLARAKSAVLLHRSAGNHGPLFGEAQSRGSSSKPLRLGEQRVTLAARNELSGNNEDSAGIDEDFAELEAWEAEDEGKT